MKLLNEARGLESHYNEGTIDIVDGLPFSQKEKITTAEYYTNSKYISGNRDELGREKPFYNIVNFRVQVAKVATDLDVKDINILAENPKDWVRTMLLQHEVYQWMKETNFADTLNEMGEDLPRYGGVLVKKVEKDGELEVQVVKWKNVCTDQVDIINNPILEKHYLTVGELYKKNESWDNVDKVIEHAEKENGDSLLHSDRIEVWELRGNMPVAWKKEAQGLETQEEDYWVYEDVVAYIYTDLNDSEAVLYCEKEEFPYKYLAWDRLAGRGLGRGVVEESEEAQIWTNDAVINEKHAMDLAGRVGIKTTDDGIGDNILEHDHGKVYKLRENTDMQAFSMTPSALGQFDNLLLKWENQVDKATSTFDANTGEQPPSGTPYSQTALLNQVASRPFDYRREQKGIFLTEIFTDWVIPDRIKKLNKEHVLASEFSDKELAVIDSDFALYEENKRVIDAMIQGNVTSQQEYLQNVQSYKDNLKGSGNERYLKVPKGYFKGVESRVTVQVTNEQFDKRVALESLSTVLQTVASSFNPETGAFAILEDETLGRIFGEIIELSGVGISASTLLGSQTRRNQSAPTPATKVESLPVEEPVA